MLELEGFEPLPIPGPKPTALVGARTLVQRFLDDPVRGVLERRPYGDLVAVVDEDPAIVCVFGTRNLQAVLGSPRRFQNLESFPHRSATTPSLTIADDGLPRLNGHRHERHRRLMQAAFTPERLDEQAEQVMRVTRATVDRWPLEGVVRVDDLCRELVSRVVVTTLLGLPAAPASEELGRLMAKLHDARAAPAKGWLPEVNLPGLPHRRAHLLAKEVTRKLLEAVEAKRQAPEPAKDALGHVIAAARTDPTGLTDEELVGEALTLFSMAHEPTVMAIVWTLLLLDQHPATLEAIQSELDEVLADHPPTRSALPQLGKLDRAVKESLRLLPPTALLAYRVVSEAVELDGVALPTGANVLVSPLAAHHDGARFPHPRRFDPDRWFGLTPDRFAYLPFGAGERGCIAQAFAEQTVRLILARILQERRLRCQPGTRVDRRVRGTILSLDAGLPMRITRPKEPTDPAQPIKGSVPQLVELP